jgi:hypothetical protein
MDGIVKVIWQQKDVILRQATSQDATIIVRLVRQLCRLR